jgi:N-succinyldiaminopimelate aminotransferase
MLSQRLHGFGSNIFAEMSGLAARTGAINLGQGFPDTDGPPQMLAAATAAIDAGHNQYPPGPGLLVLRQAVAAHQRRFWGMDFDPESEVVITAGASEAIVASLLGLCNPGDEVIVFEPYYDAYAVNIAMAGAVRRCVTLRPPTFAINIDVLRSAVTPRTKAVLINNPHNPSGTVFDTAQLSAVARLCVEHDLVCISDEVYEHLLFDGRVHRPMATLPDMRDRTVTISSAAKTFNATGWKIGWACASEPLLSAVRFAKQFLSYSGGTPFQYAIAEALSLPEGYYETLRSNMQAQRDLLVSGLHAAGLTVLDSQGTYFVTTDIGSLGFEDGEAFCWQLPERCGVVAIPEVVFYDDKSVGRPLVRFAFCKRPELLERAATQLARLSDFAR